MQRIDDNIYIDVSLVTCAEYQLFVDEMREQGKFYEPDHWSIHHYPSGQAREPILGVRYSDAKAFCEWLTHRYAKQCKYRLPTEQEVAKVPLQTLGENPIGTWLNERFQFAKIGSVSNEVPVLNIDMALDRLRTLELNLSVAGDLGHIRDIAGVIEDVQYITYVLSRTGEDTRDRVFEMKRAADIALNIQMLPSRHRDFGDAPARALVKAANLAELLYYDLSNLHARITGKSPALEGIRLVKERY